MVDLCKWECEVGQDELFPFDVAKKCEEIHKAGRLGWPSFRPSKAVYSLFPPGTPVFPGFLPVPAPLPVLAFFKPAPSSGEEDVCPKAPAVSSPAMPPRPLTLSHTDAQALDALCWFLTHSIVEPCVPGAHGFFSNVFPIIKPTGTAKTAGQRCDSFDGSPSMADTSVVPDGPSVIGRRTSVAPTLSSCSPSAANSHTPPSSQDSLDSDAALRTAFTRRGISSEVTQFFLQSWRALRHNIGHISTNEFNWEPGRGYSTMNTIRSAISAIAMIADRPAG
ncbi:hypothetical protein E2C01_073877 [Portunus trituberculatus]|uniref:Uncharacterized protein n=1 Tax=Portunus trituberculatus TaxID=210409 RepID=A0A5B7IF87_PORTR|nr:hypothetical protein [Portunus trituberculatus]